jgi:hypothetical protein
MTTPAERVRRLVDAGSIAPEEGDRLLAAMSKERSRANASSASVVLNPFERFGGGTAAVIGLVVSVLSIAVSRLGVRFDGLLDLHIPNSVPPLSVSIVEQIASWIVPAICFWAYARLVTQRGHVRVIDFIGMVGLARLPLLIAAIPVLYLTPALLANPTKLTPMALVLITVALLFVAANITLLYQGFKNASGLAGPKLVAGFIVLLILAETLSKLVLLLTP